MSEERELLRAALARTTQCPDVALLAASAKSEEIRRHVASCAGCQAEVALLNRFEAAEPTAEEKESLDWIESELAKKPVTAEVPKAPAPVRAGRNWFSGWRALSWAAVTALMALAIVVYQRPGDPDGRIQHGPPVWRSTQVAAVAPIGDVAAPPAELQWRPVPDATSYHARILEVDGTVLWEGNSTESRLPIPASIAPVIIPGRAFRWDVAALDPAGRRLGVTDLQDFHIVATHR